MHLIFIWERKDAQCHMLKALDYLIPTQLNTLTSQLFLEAAEKFKTLPSQYCLIAILFKRLEFLDNEKVLPILQYISSEMQNSKEMVKYFLRKKILRFQAKTLQLLDKITTSNLIQINDFLMIYIIEIKKDSRNLFHEYITYNKGKFSNRMLYHLIKALQKTLLDKNLGVFFERKEKIAIIGRYIQFLYIIEDFFLSYPHIFEWNLLLQCIELYCEVFRATKLLYLTLPDVISFHNVNIIEFKELWQAIYESPQLVYYKNGGILFSLTNIIYKLLAFLFENQILEPINNVLTMIKSIFLLENQMNNPVKAKESFNNLKALIEESNTRFQKYIIKKLENYNFMVDIIKRTEVILGRNIEITSKSSETIEINIYHYVFYKTLKLYRYLLKNRLFFNEVISLSARLFQVNCRDLLLFVKNIRAPYDLELVSKTLKIKRKYDKESFINMGVELNERKIEPSILKTKSFSAINMKNNNIEDMTSFESKEFKGIWDVLLNYNDNNKINSEFIGVTLNEILPKIKVYFLKITYLV